MTDLDQTYVPSDTTLTRISYQPGAEWEDYLSETAKQSGMPEISVMREALALHRQVRQVLLGGGTVTLNHAPNDIELGTVTIEKVRAQNAAYDPL